MLVPLPAAGFAPKRELCPAPAPALAAPNGEDVPPDALPALPNKLPPVLVGFVEVAFPPNGELEPKSPPAEAPLEAGVPKENVFLDMTAVVEGSRAIFSCVWRRRC